MTDEESNKQPLKKSDDAIASRNSLFGIVHLPSIQKLDNANYKNIVPIFPNNVNIKSLYRESHMILTVSKILGKLLLTFNIWS